MIKLIATVEVIFDGATVNDIKRLMDRLKREIGDLKDYYLDDDPEDGSVVCSNIWVSSIKGEEC